MRLTLLAIDEISLPVMIIATMAVIPAPPKPDTSLPRMICCNENDVPLHYVSLWGNAWKTQAEGSGFGNSARYNTSYAEQAVSGEERCLASKIVARGSILAADQFRMTQEDGVDLSQPAALWCIREYI